MKLLTLEQLMGLKDLMHRRIHDGIGENGRMEDRRESMDKEREEKWIGEWNGDERK